MPLFVKRTLHVLRTYFQDTRLSTTKSTCFQVRTTLCKNSKLRVTFAVVISCTQLDSGVLETYADVVSTSLVGSLSSSESDRIMNRCYVKVSVMTLRMGYESSCGPLILKFM